MAFIGYNLIGFIAFDLLQWLHFLLNDLFMLLSLSYGLDIRGLFKF